MATDIINATDSDFNEVTANGTVLVDFWAPWCGPCRMQGEILHELAEKLDDSAKIVKVNVDDAQQVAAKFGVRSIPTLIVLKDGENVKQFVGVQDATTLQNALA
jgi:thioredoxin 1